VDNASSNDVAVGLIVKRLNSWGNSILGSKYIHMRYIAHILNLVVQDGLKGPDEHVAIERIRGAVRYIRSSPARYQRFSECVDQEKLQTNKLLCFDVPNRWNSTYMMLEAAITLRKAFNTYENIDSDYVRDLYRPDDDGNVSVGIPTLNDWKKAQRCC